MISEQALKNRIPEFGQIPSLSALSEITFSDLGKAATFRDPTALAMVKEMAWELSIALSNLISTVNPSLIVLGGKIPALGEYFLNEVREDLKKNRLSQDGRQCDRPLLPAPERFIPERSHEILF